MFSEQELKEIFEGILSVNQEKRRQAFKSFGKVKIRKAINIFKTDFGKQGIIFRKECRIHKRAKLFYGWSGYSEGVRVKCLFEGCTSLNSHFEPMIYGATNEFNEESEFYG